MNKLQRSKNDRIFSGVCGGLGEYFKTDPTIVRIACVFIGFSSLSTAFIVYLICSFVIPEDDGVIYSEEYNERNEKIRRNTPLILGGGLIIWGGFLLARTIFPWLTLRLMHLGRYWPLLLILLGLYIIFNQKDK